jgi:hypothetical protein
MANNTNIQQSPIVQKLANANEQAWLTLGELWVKRKRTKKKQDIYHTKTYIYVGACRSL